jgi:DNA-binding NtrC family response regulator
MLRLAVRFEESIRYFELPTDRCSLGAAPDADLHLPLPGISRLHATLERRGRSLHLVDLGSKNGLLRAGQRHPEITLAPGEAVQIGRAWLRLEEVDSSDARLGIDFALPSENATGRVPRRGETDSLLDAHGEGESALAALRWVRRAHAVTLDPTDAQAKPLLDAAQEVLAAESLFVLDRGSDGADPTLRLCSGALPDEALLREAAHEAGLKGPRAPRSSAVRCAPLDGGRSLVASPAGVELAVAAVLPQPPERFRAWQRDFLEHVAEKVRPHDGHRRGEGRRSEPERRLELPPEFVVGESAAMRGLLESLQAAAKSDLDVLLLGETGTGKEFVARAVHASGPTARGPFIAINCAAIPIDLLEAELFGVEARVATGVDPRPGLFLKAEGGSLFLDEIGDMPEPLQAKLLRALQEREVLPIGSHQPKKIRVRVISASNKNLPDLVRAGRYRADLFYRLRGLQFHLPPLRERRDDIPALVMAFASAAAARYGKRLRGVSRKALALLTEYDWPGNVRELKSEVERAALLAVDGHALESEQFAPIRWAIEQRARHGDGPWDREENGHDAAPARAVERHPPPPGEPSGPDERSLQERVDELERDLIQRTLALTRGNKTEAARRLGITRNGLAMKMKRLALA